MRTALFQKIHAKKASIAILGLGYVGLSLVEAFGKAGFPIIGYDKDPKKIKALHQGKFDLMGVDLPNLPKLILSGGCKISSSSEILEGADIFIIAVPTPVDLHKQPDISHVQQAALDIQIHLKKNSLVVLQSSSYPGTTEEEVLPILEKSGLKKGLDFHLAFVPEISDFGNLDFNFFQIPKIVGGSTSACAKITKKLYSYVACSVTTVSSPKVAEACKLIQNSYRLINISFINEMKIMLDQLGIDIWEVVEAAAKKPFGFSPFYPSAGAGGDCIPINAYYLIWKGKEVCGHTSLLELASEINVHMPEYVVSKTMDALNQEGLCTKNAKILILGVAFKKDVSDIREAPSLQVIRLLQEKGAKVSYHDPYVPKISPSKKFPKLSLSSISLSSKTLAEFDCVVIITDHTSYKWEQIFKYSKKIVDTRNVVKRIKNKRIEEKVVKA